MERRPAPPPWEMEAHKADAVVEDVLRPFLPEVWPPREIVSPPGETPVILKQSLPVSSLCYFPRRLPRLEEALTEAGFPIVSEGGTVTRFEIPEELVPAGKQGEEVDVTIVLSSEASLRYEISQMVEGKVAIVIDDAGLHPPHPALFDGLDYPLTVAVLPRLPHTKDWDEFLHFQGYEVLLHCPLQAVDPELDPGPGSIRTDLQSEEIRSIFQADLAEVPHAAGVNNHMGSAFTLHTEAMRALLSAIGEQSLFFLDSLTAPRTVTKAVAEETGTPFLSRDVFLDHENTEEFILSQLQALKVRAKKRGWAVAIGHCRPLTFEVLRRELPRLAQDNLQIVPLSDLIQKTNE